MFAILTVAIMYFGFNFLKGIDFLNTTNQYYAIYDDVAGLNVSNLVKISGFTVGRVSHIDINQEYGNKILVELDIARDILIGDSAIAYLQIDLLGGVSILLDVGDISKPVEPGDTIGAQVDPTLAELLQESALPVADNLQITIRRINSLLEDFSNNTESLKNIADNVEGITFKTNKLLSDNQQNINATFSSMKTASEKLNQRLDELGALMGNYAKLADSLSAINFNETLSNTNDLMKNLNKTVDLLNSETGSLGRFLNDDSLYVNLNQVLIDLDKLLIHMNENPKHFFGPLGKSRNKIEKDLQKQENEKNEN